MRWPRPTGSTAYFLNKWVKFLDTPAAKALPALKDWFALKTDAVGRGGRRQPPRFFQKAVAEGEQERRLVHKAVVTDQAAPFFIAPADAEKFVAEDDKPKLAEIASRTGEAKEGEPTGPTHCSRD